LASGGHIHGGWPRLVNQVWRLCWRFYVVNCGRLCDRPAQPRLIRLLTAMSSHVQKRA